MEYHLQRKKLVVIELNIEQATIFKIWLYWKHLKAPALEKRFRVLQFIGERSYNIRAHFVEQDNVKLDSFFSSLCRRRL